MIDGNAATLNIYCWDRDLYEVVNTLASAIHRCLKALFSTSVYIQVGLIKPQPIINGDRAKP